MDLILAPKRYIQKEGLIRRLEDFLKAWGQNFLFIADARVASIIKNTIEENVKRPGYLLKFLIFDGECCDEEIGKIELVAHKQRADVVIGCGGGKVIDAAKAAAFDCSLPFISFPTSAATCAAWSSSCPLYLKSGEYAGTRELRKSPDLVLVDSEILAKGPSRLISAGMGDALAKWYEGKSTIRNVKDDTSLRFVVLDLSKNLYKIIKRFGPQAKKDVDNDLCSLYVDSVIQANILLAGMIGSLGGKSFRSAAAHAFNYALCGIPKAVQVLHGERVAIGVLIQLVLAGEKEEVIKNLMRTYQKIGVPCSVEEMGIYFSKEELKVICAKVCSDERVANLPFPVDEVLFEEAFLEINNLANALFRAKKER